jgi:hypothetical protein
MSEAVGIRFRRMPDGEFHQAPEMAWRGRILEIGLPAGTLAPELAVGVLVEIQSAEGLYLGVLEEASPERLCVRVEHAVRWEQVEWIQDVWG